MDAPAGRARDPWLVILLAIHIGVGLVAILTGGSADDSDIERFAQISGSSGTPWRDFEVEYAPGEALLILALPEDAAMTASAVAAVSLAADLAIAMILLRRWSRTASVAYLAAMLPLLTFVFARLDLVVVALLIAGVAAVARRPGLGGTMLAVAVATKLWPLVIAPIVLRRHRAAARVFLAVLLVVSVGWVVWGGPDAIRQVATFRGATGWSVESTIGSIVWVVTGGPVTVEAGAPRTGEAGLAWRLMLLTAFALIWWWVDRRSRRWDGEPLATPSLATLGALLLVSPLFSLQYACWLAPSAALAWAEPRSRRVAVPAMVAIALTGLEFVVLQRNGGGALTQATVITRNIAVAWMTIAALRALAVGHDRRAQQLDVTTS